MKAETITKKIRPILISAEVNLNASAFFPREIYSVKIGINEADNAPAITTWNTKSGILKAAKNTPRSLDAPKRETSSRYLRIPRIWDKTVVSIIKEAAVKMLVCLEVRAPILLLTIFETIVNTSISC